MKRQIVGMVLAGGRVDELSVLTAKRPKSAVPVWGMYRFIDFVLSNMMHSGIDAVGVVSQYRPYSLNAHLANGAPWDYVGRTRELRTLSPYRGSADTDWYRGTADAVYQNLIFLEHHSPELVIIASGDHVYSMDYRPMIRQHIASKAELTIALKRVPREVASRFGTAVLDESGRVVTYEEKAAHPVGDLASLTVYVFNADVLVDRLHENAAEGRSYQIYSEIIPRMVAEGAQVHGYVFEGYWRYARTLDTYFAANMDIISPSAPELARWQVRTNLTSGTLGDPAPALFLAGGDTRDSLICPGACIAGTVEASIVSPGVIVEAGAVVRNSIVMHDGRICAGAVLDRAVLDKHVVVGSGARIGADDVPAPRLRRSRPTGELTVIGKGTRIPAEIAIGRGCIVHPDLDERHFRGTRIAAGTTVGP